MFTPDDSGLVCTVCGEGSIVINLLVSSFIFILEYNLIIVNYKYYFLNK